MSIPARFIGAWELVSFETTAPDGSVSRPWGDDPVGIIIWSASGHVSAQLGPRDRTPGAYIAYYGTLEAHDAQEGELVHATAGASNDRLLEPQRRRFRFIAEDLVELSPAAGADGAVSRLRWRRLG